MYGPDPRPSTGQGLRERQASEGQYEYMESRSREAESEDQVERDVEGYRQLCRAVIVRALRELGSGLGQEREEVWGWVNSNSFEQISIWAGWGDGWILDLFRGVYRLNKSVRKKITHDCVIMLKALGDLE